ncbi:hypothetical protein [Rhodoferax antarcticus]|uniref:Uncharacterized protein n=1 Tax=Rhodoferax antarcticus ANT.BR TaxID=1111071 RepID=A0A1Q8Y980_9BURK|nr:hypothetical protein [Rhodoferax antarcticus]OLP04612.1 hypothetical protein BLL52_4323 [Rhodoferax antarcticus ANT.BR]
MKTDSKRGRPFKSKSWDLLLRHTFRTSYLEDAGLHALLFISGDHFTEIIQKALREFVIKNELPTSDPTFQSDLYLAAATLTNTNREKPDAKDVLQRMNRIDVLARINELINSPSAHATVAVQPTQPLHVHLTQLPSPATMLTPLQSAPNVEPIKTKPRLPLPKIDLGPEIDEEPMVDSDSSSTPVAQKPSLKDKWLQQHNY